VKFLVDQNLSTRLCTYLDDAGHEAVHVEELSLSMAEDVEILERARTDASVIISSDTDFGMLLAAQRASSPSVVLTREVSTLPASDLAKVLLMNLETFAADLEAGAIVAISPRGIRIRRLPLR